MCCRPGALRVFLALASFWREGVGDLALVMWKSRILVSARRYILRSLLDNFHRCFWSGCVAAFIVTCFPFMSLSSSLFRP
jgi:hypothetical protein